MALSACPSNLDLESVGLHVGLRQTLMSVSMRCPLIERLLFESSKTGKDDSLKSPTCVDFVNNCPRLTSLALRGFKLPDNKICILLKESWKWDRGESARRLILQDCMHLKEVEVARLLTAVLAGDFKFLQLLDISNREGLDSEGDWYVRCFRSRIILLKEVSEERPDICMLSKFPSEGKLFVIHVLWLKLHFVYLLSEKLEKWLQELHLPPLFGLMGFPVSSALSKWLTVSSITRKTCIHS